jgi:hypothetical protein
MIVSLPEIQIPRPGSGKKQSKYSGRAPEHDPEKACPGLDPGWKPVFGKDHAQTKSDV